MKHWIEAARLRTLPLSVSGIIVGSMYALANPTENILTPTEVFNWRLFGFAILTTLGLQILSNFANDYGDGLKGTDNDTAYGYKGFGDLFVFIFFGLVSTLGVNFLYSKQLDAILFLPAIAIGLLSVGVLNLNNMRDEASDRKSNKNTIVVKIGGAKAKKYHYFLIISAMVLIVLFAVLSDFNFDQYLFLLAYIPLTKHLITVSKNQEPRLLDPELKKLALSTFALSILLALCMIYFFSDVIVNTVMGGR
jgi:1,4-dihydroxy-2-naphthoate octaprenyltransferase